MRCKNSNYSFLTNFLQIKAQYLEGFHGICPFQGVSFEGKVLKKKIKP